MCIRFDELIFRIFDWQRCVLTRVQAMLGFVTSLDGVLWSDVRERRLIAKAELKDKVSPQLHIQGYFACQCHP